MKKVLQMTMLAAILIIPTSASAQEGPGWVITPNPTTVTVDPSPGTVNPNQEGPGW